ncbi:MAG: ABC transporter permease [Bacteroidales bacterium]|nr:ABC transporter permease [Bacteroidales bacterium]
MIKNYFKIAFRNLWKNKVFSILNTLGLAIALAIALIIFLFINNELSTDKFQKNRDNIYLVSTMDYYTTPPVLIKSLGENIPGLESKLRLFSRSLVAEVESSKIQFSTYFADSSFFNFFSFKLLQGDRANVLKEKEQIVLTESLAKKIFGTTNAVGKTLNLSRTNSTEKKTYLVSGIMEDVPDNSSIRFEAVTNFFSLENLFGDDFEDDFSEWSYTSLLMLNKNTDLKNFKEVFDKRLIDFFLENSEEATEDDFIDEDISELIPFSSLYFDRPDIQVFRQGNKNFIYIYLSIALFILLIAVVNYVNLSTAISFERNKETGVRMVFGAQKNQLILKFLLESIIITFIAFVLACMIAEIVLPTVNSKIPGNINLHLFKNQGILIVFIIGSLVFGIINGLVPAVYLSRVDVAKILKGEITKGKRAEKLRSGLIIFQFLISAVLISFTLTVSMQLSYLKNMDMGFEKENIIKIPLSLNIQDKKKILKAEVLNLPFVEKASIVRGVPGEIGMRWGLSYKEDDIHFTAMPVDEHLVSLLNMKITKGRDFNKGDLQGAFIINETMAKKLETENPIGEKIGDDPIVGVVKNFNFQSARFHVGSLAMYFGEGFWDYRNYLLVKLMPGTSTERLNEIHEIWDSFSPDFPFEYAYLGQSLEKLYKDEKKFGDLFTLFSILSLFIVCIGLFGLSAYVVKQKTKEIGIRKVLGAFNNSILFLLSKKFLFLVITANIISIPIAWYIMDTWLTNFANRITIPYYVFVISFVLSIIITVITVSWQALYAARMNPVEAIKYE